MLTTPPSRVEQKKEDKRRRLLAAALELFSERGVLGTAVPLVAERAEVGAGTVYRFFESKEALVNEVFREAKARLRLTLEEGLDFSLPPKALFDAFWARLCRFARAEPVAFHFLEMQDHAPYLDEESRALERQVLAPIFAACVRFQAEGVLRPEVPVDVAMALVWGAFVGLIKAERLGYLELGEANLAQARDACWRAFTKA
jgi:TetR/AcrR family transcriptional regulator, repressor of fatR-cypB operon